MEAITRAAFPEIEGPLLEIENVKGNFSTYADVTLWVKSEGDKIHRNFNIKQKMTWLGKVSAELVDGPDCFEGVNRQMLLEDGRINVDNVDRTIKMSCGVVATSTTMSVISPETHPWRDNHTSLLLNLMRFTAFLKFMEMNEATFAMYGVYPTYSDGHVTIDPNEFFDEEYEVNNFKRWPSGPNKENYPEYQRLVSAKGATDGECLDLRGLSTKQCKIILMMLAKWERRSRYRLDFNTDKLAHKIYYRSDQNVTMEMPWAITEETQGQVPNMPPLPSHKEVWEALLAYVDINRVWTHFSAAVYLFCSSTAQMVPQTAEGQIWLDLEMKLTIPAFRSIRGRHEFINAGEPGSCSPRPLADWIHVGRQFERLMTIAVVVSQAIYFGLGVRSMRRGIEKISQDLDVTEDAFFCKRTMVSAAMAEALRRPIPLPGMSEVGILIDGWYEDRLYQPRKIEILTILEGEIEGYDIERGEECNYLNVHYYNIPGIPTLLLPLHEDVLPENNPFKLKGEIKPDKDKEYTTRKGWDIPYYKAYEWAVLARWCGWDVLTADGDKLLGSKRFYAPNDSSWTWPSVLNDGWRGRLFRLNGIKEREKWWIPLPYNHFSPYSKEVEWYVNMRNKGTSSVADVFGRPVKTPVAQADPPIEARAVLSRFTFRQLDPRGWMTSEQLIRGGDGWVETSEIVFNVLPTREVDDFGIMVAGDLQRVNDEIEDNPALPHNV